MNDPKHPPLNTPLSAFTPAMLDALPVGSRFDEANTNGGVLEKCPDGWRYIDGSRCECVGFPDGYNGDRPLIRVGPEQASESAPSAPLPDPWPGLLFEWVDGDWIRRDRVKWSFTNANANTRVTVEDHPHKVDWAPNHIREVRTPDGVTLWKRPAGGAS